jgi:hypothetical protein
MSRTAARPAACDVLVGAHSARDEDAHEVVILPLPSNQ